MKTLKEYQELNEKQILFNKGSRFGQVVFVVGGSASGKGFAISNFMEKAKFKVRDVDEWKSALIKLDAIANQVQRKAKQKGIDTKKKFGISVKDFKLSNSKDVFILHKLVADMGIKDKTLNLLLSNARSAETLPNIMFDITLKGSTEKANMEKMISRLVSVGYKPQNIHLVWILTKYAVAIERNMSRSRVVPADIVLQSHVGTAQNMIEIIRGQVPKKLDGAIHIVLNNKENTIFWKSTDGRPTKIKESLISEALVKSFAVLRLKAEGRPIIKTNAVYAQLYSWIINNVPKEALNKKTNIMDVV
jgi:dephospho-CoA kinase